MKDKLNRNAEFKLNEVYRVYGEEIQLAFEKWTNARFEALENGTPTEPDAGRDLWNAPLTLAQIDDLRSYADHYVDTVIQENIALGIEFHTKPDTPKDKSNTPPTNITHTINRLKAITDSNDDSNYANMSPQGRAKLFEVYETIIGEVQEEIKNARLAVLLETL